MRRAFLASAVAILIALAAYSQTTPRAPKAPRTPRPPVTAMTPPPEPPDHQDVMVMRGGGSYLGVDVRDITPDRVAALKLKAERGVEITMVDQDAPAGKAGLKEHDVILSFNGNPVDSAEQLRRMIRETPPGRTVALGISRDGQPLTINAQLAERKKYISRPMHIEIPKIEIPPMDFDFDFPTMLQYSRRNGLVVENLTPQLGEFFGVKNGQGVLVRSVEKGSPAEAAGFKAGDVIIRVGNERVSDASDWSRLVRQSAGGSVTVGIVRERKEQTLSFNVPDRRRKESRLELSLPALEVDLDGLGEEIEQAVEHAFSSGRMIALQREPMERMQQELARMGPEVQRALERAHREVQESLCDHQQMKKELDRERKQMQQEFKKQQQELRKEMQKLRRTSTVQVI